MIKWWFDDSIDAMAKGGWHHDYQWRSNEGCWVRWAEEQDGLPQRWRSQKEPSQPLAIIAKHHWRWSTSMNNFLTTRCWWHYVDIISKNKTNTFLVILAVEPWRARERRAFGTALWTLTAWATSCCSTAGPRSLASVCVGQLVKWLINR